eukprot:jgi/Tetstr1/447814/TSEL_035144.t1
MCAPCQTLQGDPRLQVVLHLHSEVIAKIPAFADNCSPELVAQLAEALDTTMRALGNVVMKGKWPHHTGGGADLTACLINLEDQNQRRSLSSPVVPETDLSKAGGLQASDPVGLDVLASEHDMRERINKASQTRAS